MMQRKLLKPARTPMTLFVDMEKILEAFVESWDLQEPFRQFLQESAFQELCKLEDQDTVRGYLRGRILGE